ncbi:hypothetical protein Q4I30_006923 [Leishmania utingensis]|uniref:PH domain-containing protein n=1 Tax=Leishmania utingensis TaxID=653362 RepID=A0AAW2ZZD7_9TRYP
MDPGSVLDNLLARHRGFVVAAQHTAVAKAHRRHGSISSTAPPSKIVEAVERGVNPLMLGLQAHKTESAAREKAKARRRGLSLDVSRTSPEPPAQSGTASSSLRTAANQSKNASVSTTTVLTTHTQLPAVLATKEMQRSREMAVSATLTSRYQELRAKRLQEDEERKRSRSDPMPALRNTGGGAGQDGEKGAHKHARMEEKRLLLHEPPLRATTATTVSQTRRDVWRRRCTTRKILRNSRRVSRASALRRYWYTALSNNETRTGTRGSFSPAMHAVCTAGSETGEEEGAATVTLASKTIPTSERLVCSTPPLSMLALNDATEKRCAIRRLRAAHRSAREVHYNIQIPRKRGDVVTGVRAAAAMPETGQVPAVAAQLAADRSAVSRPSRRQRKEVVRCILSSSATRMWTLAAGVVAERLNIVAQLRLECASATAPASVLATRTKGVGALPLSLARLFPLFGAVVEVQELELTAAPVRSRRSRGACHAHFASATGGESAWGAPQLRVLKQRKGIVMEEYSETLGILLLPSENRAEMQAWADEVARLRAQGQGTLACVSEDYKVAPLTRMKSSPSIVRVPKHFPGASGSFVELVQLLLLRTPTMLSISHSDRGSMSAPSTVARIPATSVGNLRVLVAVFCGEVSTAAEDCDLAARHADCDDAVPPVAAEGIRSTAYPLHRLLHRCL